MIYFIGAGPGDVELITVKGAKIIQSCDVIIYAGSLVNVDLIKKYAKDDAKIYDSSKMNLDEIIDVMKKASKEDKDVARVHTGDPAIYGAIREQMVKLGALNISYKVIPGVSSFCAAAAVLGRELTVPDVSQTVIITRSAGRTPVPEGESIASLAKHEATMAIFLSIGRIEEVVEELKTSYSSDTPVAVVYKATWQDEKKIVGTLDDIADKVRSEGIKKTALILVGDFLGDKGSFSKLYDPNFSHEFRKREEV